jgi:hypothetical protein
VISTTSVRFERRDTKCWLSLHLRVFIAYSFDRNSAGRPSGSLAATLLVSALAPFGEPVLLAALGLGGLGVLVLLALLILRAQNALLRPALARP